VEYALKAHASYLIERVTDQYVYLIEQADETHLRIADDAAFVLESLQKSSLLLLGSRKVIYLDSMGVFMQISHDNGKALGVEHCHPDYDFFK
jgi:hypothetical protein